MLLAAPGGLEGCSQTDEDAVPACVPGKVASCPCPGGGESLQTCASDGTFGPCGCGTTGSPVEPGGPDDALDIQPDLKGPEGADTASAPEPEPTPGPEVPITEEPAGEGAERGETCEPCGYGSLRGLVCAPKEGITIPNAEVTVTALDCDGSLKEWSTFTDADGIYDFPELPCGLHPLGVKAGSFEMTYTAKVDADKDNDITGAAHKQCFAFDAVKIAVLWGQWDELEGLLDQLGLAHDFYEFSDEFFDDVPKEDIEAYQLLTDKEKLAAYDILFFDCGSAALGWVKNQEIGENLAWFVLQGGSMYASDLSWAYIEAAFPDAIDFYGDDDLPGTAMASDGPQQVDGHQDVPATVVDTVLQQYLGASTFTAKYGPGPLIAVDAPGPDTTVHVQGIVQIINPDQTPGWPPPPDTIPHAGPFVLSFQPGPTAGRVVYTTFHNDEQADELITKILYYLVFLL